MDSLRTLTKRAHAFSAWSNLFYLVPCALAYHYSLFVLAGSILLLFIASTGLHLFRTHFFSDVDLICAYEIAIAGIGLIVLSQIINGYFLLALACLGVGLYLYLYVSKCRRDTPWHGFWHLCVAGSLSFAILLFVQSHLG